MFREDLERCLGKCPGDGGEYSYDECNPPLYAFLFFHVVRNQNTVFRFHECQSRGARPGRPFLIVRKDTNFSGGRQVGVGLALSVRWSAVNISTAMFARASSERTKRCDLPSAGIAVGTIEWRERGGKWAGGSGSRLLRAHPPPSAPMFAASAASAPSGPRQCLPRQRQAHPAAHGNVCRVSGKRPQRPTPMPAASAAGDVSGGDGGRRRKARGRGRRRKRKKIARGRLPPSARWVLGTKRPFSPKFGKFTHSA